jgi:hypothetical protein
MHAHFNNDSNLVEMKKIFVLIVFSLSCQLVWAQKDTTKKQTVDIISAYQPELKPANKINVSGSPLSADTNKFVRPYSIPAYNLIYSYQSIPLKPLALQQDSLLYLGATKYCKAGFGNLRTPFIAAAASFGDPSAYLANVYATYTSSKGKIVNQDYALFEIKGTGSYFLPTHEIFGSMGYSSRQYNLYGYNHDLYEYSKSDVSQPLNLIEASVGIRNTAPNNWGIQYEPLISLNVFSNKNKLQETTVAVSLPVQKQLNANINIKAAVDINLTQYKTSHLVPQDVSLQNNLLQFQTAAVLTKKEYGLQAGIKLVSNNGHFDWLPNITAQYQVPNQPLTIEAGWVGDYTKNTYQQLSSQNPYVSAMTQQINTKTTDIYGGLRYAIQKHLFLSGKISMIRCKDFQFFVNDTTTNDAKSFVMSNEASLNIIRLYAEISYIRKEKLTATAGLTLNEYSGLQSNLHAWGVLPLEFAASLRWQALKKILVTSSVYSFTGGYYLAQNNASGQGAGGFDMKMGVEYKINNRFNAFLDLNNIFGNSYERWHQYPVYGFNALAGVVVRFN